MSEKELEMLAAAGIEGASEFTSEAVLEFLEDSIPSEQAAARDFFWQEGRP